jgi:hypothetical protein
LDVDIVVNNRHQLHRHAVNLRVSDVRLQLVAVQNQEVPEKRRINEIFHDHPEVHIDFPQIAPDIANFAGKLLYFSGNRCDFARVLNSLCCNLGNSRSSEQLMVFSNNIVLHLLEKANQSLALSSRPFALEHRHKHVDTLFGKNVGTGF